MHLNVNEFIEEQKQGLAELVENFSRSRVAAARNAARESAARIKALNGRVRALARSGVRLNAVSHGAAQDLIELQAEIVGSALTDAAAKIERMAYTETVRDLARMQSDVLQAARQRIVEDIARTVNLLRGVAGEARRAVSAAPSSKAGNPARRPAARRRAAAVGGSKVTRAKRRSVRR